MTREEIIKKDVRKIIIEDVWKFAIHCMELGYGADILKQYTPFEAMEKLEKFQKLEQIAPCGDAISRDEAWKLLDDFNSYLSSIILREVDETNCQDIISNIRIKAGELRCNIVQNLPSVQPKAKTEWIPVSERLPELCVNGGSKKYPIMKSKPVYISYVQNGHNYVCPIPCVLYSNGQWYNDEKSLEDWVTLHTYDSRVDSPLCVRVTAWMPLPEPYKESEE